MKRTERKGQGAMEYLMTYGWALIVIAIVVGVLVFIVSSPTSGVQCNSSDSTKWILKSSNLLVDAGDDEAAAAPGAWVVKLQNATGGNVTVRVVPAASGSFVTSLDELILDETIHSGQELTIQPRCVTPGAADDCDKTGTSIFGQWKLEYNDQFGYAKDVTVTCQGTLA